MSGVLDTDPSGTLFLKRFLKKESFGNKNWSILILNVTEFIYNGIYK
jgi:hypothetical protein